MIAYLPTLCQREVAEIYERISRIAAEKGLSVREVERRCGFTYGTLRRWERVSPSVQKAYLVAKVLNVSIEELME